MYTQINFFNVFEDSFMYTTLSEGPESGVSCETFTCKYTDPQTRVVASSSFQFLDFPTLPWELLIWFYLISVAWFIVIQNILTMAILQNIIKYSDVGKALWHVKYHPKILFYFLGSLAKGTGIVGFVHETSDIYNLLLLL